MKGTRGCLLEVGFEGGMETWTESGLKGPRATATRCADTTALVATTPASPEASKANAPSVSLGCACPAARTNPCVMSVSRLPACPSPDTMDISLASTSGCSRMPSVTRIHRR